jgi:hypothetical protein
MCFSDWQFGRLIRSIVRGPLDPNNPASATLSANPDRVGFDVYVQDPLADLLVSALNDQGALHNYIIRSDALPYRIRMNVDGDLSTKSFSFASESGDTNDVTVIEYIASEASLRRALEEFNRLGGRM